MAEPNVLLLDEPTNDLDIDTLRQLEDLLDSWPGTMVVISHDRYLVERICDSVWALFGDGALTNLPGGIDEYLRRRSVSAAAGDSGKLTRAEAAGGAAGASVSGDGVGTGGAAGGTGGNGGAGTPARAVDAATERTLRKEMNKLERQIAKLDEREAAIHVDMTAASEVMDTGRLTDLDRELKALQADKESLEERWMEIGDELEG